jgi:ATP-dependent Lon protease
LDKNHYGLESVKDTILEYLSALALNMQTSADKEVKAPVICLVGLVGTGKTSLAISIAEALGRKFERIPFGGMGDSLALRGQSRAFSDAEPGLIIKKLVHAGSRNSVILLDELDRVAEAARADIMGVLIELLDPEQNKGFTDHYIDYPFDLSHVLFVATANNTTNISTAVLDRLEIIQMPSYSDDEKKTIARDYLFPKAQQGAGLSQLHITIEDDIWPMIIRPLGYDSGIRSLERTLETIVRRIARMIIEGKLTKDGSIALNAQNIKQFLPA